MSKTYTDKELVELGRKVVAQRQKQAVTAKSRRTLQSKLYQMYKAGELGNIKV